MVPDIESTALTKKIKSNRVKEIYEITFYLQCVATLYSKFGRKMKKKVRYPSLSARQIASVSVFILTHTSSNATDWPALTHTKLFVNSVFVIHTQG